VGRWLGHLELWPAIGRERSLSIIEAVAAGRPVRVARDHVVAVADLLGAYADATSKAALKARLAERRADVLDPQVQRASR
jgi:hypothetical protein